MKSYFALNLTFDFAIKTVCSMPTNKVALKLQNSLIALSNIGSKRPSMTSIVGQITCQVPYLQRQVSMASLLVVRKNTYIAI